jgi:hypothetical protein
VLVEVRVWGRIVFFSQRPGTFSKDVGLLTGESPDDDDEGTVTSTIHKRSWAAIEEDQSLGRKPVFEDY